MTSGAAPEMRSFLSDNDDLTDNEVDILNYISVSTAVLSMFGSLFIIIAILYFHKLTDPALSFKLVFVLSMSDVVHMATRFFVKATHVSWECYVQAIASQFSTTSNIVVVACIAYEVFLIEPEEVGDDRPHIRFRWYVAITLALSVLATVVVFIPSDGHDAGLYGEADSWCWIRDTQLGQVWRFSTLYGPLWCVVGYISWVYYKVYTFVRKQVFSADAVNASRRSSMFESNDAKTRLVLPCSVALRGVPPHPGGLLATCYGGAHRGGNRLGALFRSGVPAGGIYQPEWHLQRCCVWAERRDAVGVQEMLLS